MDYTPLQSESVPASHPVRAMGRFWADARPLDDLPDWRQFDPMQYSRIIPWMLVLKPEADGGMRYAVCGTKCQEIFGFSYQNKRFGEDLPEEAVRTRQAEFENIFRNGEPVYSATSLPIQGRKFIEVYRGVFPFLDQRSAQYVIAVVLAPIRERIRVRSVQPMLRSASAAAPLAPF